jgi:Fe-S-cluster containining protein
MTNDLNPLYYRLIKLPIPKAGQMEEFMENGEWVCTGCGACCKSIDKDLPSHLQHMDRGDGVCKNLLEDNTCAIYEKRPRECRLRRWYNDDLIHAGFCARAKAAAPDLQGMRIEEEPSEM